MSSCSVQIMSFIHSSATTACWWIISRVLSGDFLHKMFLAISWFYVFFWKISKRWFSCFTCFGGSSFSERIALLSWSSFLFPWKTCRLTVLEGLRLFVERDGNELVCTTLAKVIWSSTDVFRCPMSPCALIWWPSLSVGVGCSFSKVYSILKSKIRARHLVGRWVLNTGSMS